jgi:hypothetical protein
MCSNFTSAVGDTTPWIWSVIRFSLDGNRLPADLQIFPTYSIYEDGQLLGTVPQSNPESFIALDDTSQRHVADIP